MCHLFDVLSLQFACLHDRRYTPSSGPYPDLGSLAIVAQCLFIPFVFPFSFLVFIRIGSRGSGRSSSAFIHFYVLCAQVKGLHFIQFNTVRCVAERLNLLFPCVCLKNSRLGICASIYRVVIEMKNIMFLIEQFCSLNKYHPFAWAFYHRLHHHINDPNGHK